MRILKNINYRKVWKNESKNQSAKTCNCKCNPQGNGTDASQSGDSKLLTKATFWSGDTCQTCEQPDKNPCPGSRTFNLTKCGCKPPLPRPPTISLLHILLITIIIVVVVGVATGLIVHFTLQKKKS